jgi:hypothetical protein
VTQSRRGRFTDDRLLPGRSEWERVDGCPIPEEMFEGSCKHSGPRLARHTLEGRRRPTVNIDSHQLAQ